MALKVIIEGNAFSITVPGDIMEEGESFFEKMDKDMDKGWMMNREWIDNPSQLQRCQIAADRIADSINNENETLTYLMAGYILTRMKDVKEIHIDTEGDMMETEFITS